jgi:hypothetical protein
MRRGRGAGTRPPPNPPDPHAAVVSQVLAGAAPGDQREKTGRAGGGGA